MSFLNLDKFKLGQCLVLPKHNKLIVDGEECKVEPKIMQVLCYLIDHQGEVVSRDKIAKSLWPDTVIGLEVVTRAIFELRKILKDDPKKPTFIETIARKGYCFIYVPLHNCGQNVAEKQREKKASRTFSIHEYTTVFLVFIISILSFIFIIAQYETPKITHLTNLKATLLTDINYYSESPVLSPDRSQVLFTKKTDFKETENQLVLLNLTTQKQSVIDEGGTYNSIQWLRDNHHWYYVKCVKIRGCDVIKHTIQSGNKESIYQSEYPILYIALSDEYQSLFVSRLVNNELEIANVSRTNPSDITTLDTPEKNNAHLLLGHDHRFLYFTSTLSGGSSTLYQYDIKQKKYQIINEQFSRLYGISLKDNNSLWIAGDLDGKRGLWSFDFIEDKLVSEFLATPGHTLTQVNARIDYSNIIYSNLTRTINIETAGVTGISPMVNVNSSMIEMNAVYSPTQEVMYFSSNRNGLYDIWKYQDDEVERVTNISADLIERPVITKQENKMAFISRTNSTLEVKLFDMLKNAEIGSVILTKKVFLLSWSNDQQLIYYSRFDEGQYNIYALNTETFESEKVLLNAGAIAQESDDGKYLYYGDMLNGQLMRKSSEGEVSIVFKLPVSDLEGVAPHRLKVIGDNLYFIGMQDKKSVLKRYSFTDKTLQVLLTLPKDIYVTDIINETSTGVIFDRFSKMNSTLIQLH